MELEVGKYCRTRAGRKAGPVYETGNCEFPFEAFVDGFGVQGYTAKGCWHSMGAEHSLDLIAEWVDEPAAPKPAGPVRTITRKEIVPGVYGSVSVHELTTDCTKSVWIALVGYGAEKEGTLHARLSTDELTAAIATLSEIADAMEENSK